MNRIIFFVNGHTSPGQISGGDVRFREIAKRMNQFEKYIITSKFGHDIYMKEKIYAKYFITSNDMKETNIILLYLQRTFKSLFLNFNISDGDVIYSNSDFLPNVLPAFFLKLRNKNCRWVVCIYLIIPELFKDYANTFVENNRFSMPNFNRFFYFLNQKLTIFLTKRWSNQILVLNKIDKDYLVEKRKIDRSLISVVNGGINYNYIMGIHPKNMNQYEGVFLGRFHPQKGIFDLIKIWKLVCIKKPESRLCIIGNGPEQFIEKIKMIIKENCLVNNVTLVGSKFDEEKFLLLKSCKIFLCPSYYESFAIVISEAIACGLPVIAYDLPIYADIYGSNILKIPIGDINQFAETVVKLLDDNDLRDDLSHKGQKFIQKYDWNKIFENEVKLLNNKL